MKKKLALFTALTLTLAVQAWNRQAAPDFTGTDINGKTVKLSDYAGKMSSSNPTTPTARSVQPLQDRRNAGVANRSGRQGVAWLLVNP